ncbi:MAG TPA: efflux transporter outer membrane subunit [Polyangiaceae bacterium]|nr:efflux transporter outer membrane subunit [Polyangiaceae bacterium]
MKGSCALRPSLLRWSAHVAGAAIGVVATGGCNVGPRYEVPRVGTPTAFKEASAAAYRGLPGGTWQPANPQDGLLKGRWWQLFREPELDELEERLNIDNQTIVQYFQNFMAARAQVNEARAGYFPTVSVSPLVALGGGAAAPSAANAGTSGATTAYAGAVSGATAVTSLPTTSGSTGSSITGTHYFSIPLEASWAPDLWGRIRNTVSEYRYAAQVSAADLENERLTEQASLAEYYFELRGQDALQDLYNRTIEADRKTLDLTRAQYETGVGTAQAVAQAEVTLRTAEATAVGIAVSRALYEHAIATLIGRPASDFAMPFKVLATAVPAIPIGLPSQLLQRRPDIAAAERTMAQANALIGVEKAAYYPSLSLSASGGLASTALGTLFSVPSLFWSLGVSLSETIFDGCLRDATLAQYVAMYKADVASYRQTVLTAFQQVEDYVATLRVLSQEIARQDLAVKAAQRYLDIAMAAYLTGLDPYLDVITAQTTLLGDEQTLVTLRVNEITAAVELVQALGGGWDEAQLPQASDITSARASRQLLETP